MNVFNFHAFSIKAQRIHRPLSVSINLFKRNRVKMKPLEYNLNIFRLMAICPVPDGTGARIKYRNYCFGFVIFTTAIMTTISSIVAVIVYLGIDLERALYAMFAVPALVYVSYSYVVAHIIWKRLANIFPKLEKIYDASMFGAQSVESKFYGKLIIFQTKITMRLVSLQKQSNAVSSFQNLL